MKKLLLIITISAFIFSSVQVMQAQQFTISEDLLSGLVTGMPRYDFIKQQLKKLYETKSHYRSDLFNWYSHLTDNEKKLFKKWFLQETPHNQSALLQFIFGKHTVTMINISQGHDEAFKKIFNATNNPKDLYTNAIASIDTKTETEKRKTTIQSAVKYSIQYIATRDELLRLKKELKSYTEQGENSFLDKQQRWFYQTNINNKRGFLNTVFKIKLLPQQYDADDIFNTIFHDENFLKSLIQTIHHKFNYPNAVPALPPAAPKSAALPSAPPAAPAPKSAPPKSAAPALPPAAQPRPNVQSSYWSNTKFAAGAAVVLVMVGGGVTFKDQIKDAMRNARIWALTKIDAIRSLAERKNTTSVAIAGPDIPTDHKIATGEGNAATFELIPVGITDCDLADFNLIQSVVSLPKPTHTPPTDHGVIAGSDLTTDSSATEPMVSSSNATSIIPPGHESDTQLYQDHISTPWAAKRPESNGNDVLQFVPYPADKNKNTITTEKTDPDEFTSAHNEEFFTHQSTKQLINPTPKNLSDSTPYHATDNDATPTLPQPTHASSINNGVTARSDVKTYNGAISTPPQTGKSQPLNAKKWSDLITQVTRPSYIKKALAIGLMGTLGYIYYITPEDDKNSADHSEEKQLA